LATIRCTSCDEGSCFSAVVNVSDRSRSYGLPCCCHARVCFIRNMWWVIFEFYSKVHICVYSVSAYLMLLTVLLGCWFFFRSVCGCPDCFIGAQIAAFLSAIMVVRSRCFCEVYCCVCASWVSIRPQHVVICNKEKKTG
jgi:hypothetical protein